MKDYVVSEERRKKLAYFLKEQRNEKSFGLNQFCLKANIQASQYSRLENGQLLKINPFLLKKIGEALKIDYKELYKIVGYLDEKDFEYTVLEENNNLSNNNITGNHGNVNLGKIIKSNIENKEDILLNDLTDNEKEQVRNFINFLKSQKK